MPPFRVTVGVVQNDAKNDAKLTATILTIICRQDMKATVGT